MVARWTSLVGGRPLSGPPPLVAEVRVPLALALSQRRAPSAAVAGGAPRQLAVELWPWNLGREFERYHPQGQTLPRMLALRLAAPWMVSALLARLFQVVLLGPLRMPCWHP